jgi:hypothetical protein
MDVEVRVRPPTAARGILPALSCHCAAAAPLPRVCSWLSDFAWSGSRLIPACRRGARIADWMSGRVGSVGSEATEGGAAATVVSPGGAALEAEAADLKAAVRPLEERCLTTGVRARERPTTLTARTIVQRGEALPPPWLCEQLRLPLLPPSLPELLPPPPPPPPLLMPMPVLLLPSGLRGAEIGRGGLTSGRKEAGDISRSGGAGAGA